LTTLARTLRTLPFIEATGVYPAASSDRADNAEKLR